MVARQALRDPAVKHFKYELRGKRRIHKTPAQREADACLHWLESEIELVQPVALLALGRVAARSLLDAPPMLSRWPCSTAAPSVPGVFGSPARIAHG
jgi:uracil-DNA glycosylase